MFRTPSGFIAAALVGALSAACAAQPRQVDVPMAFRPTDPLPPGAFASSPFGVKVYVGAILDKRSVQDLIGENREKPTAVPIRAAAKTPPQFVREVLVANLRAVGLDMVDSSAEADRVITCDLVQFWTTETNSYHTEVRTALSVRDRLGNVVWKGMKGGAAQRFGRSLSVENYQEVYSDATLQMVGMLLSDPQFQEALVAKGG